jgi:chromosome segregation ATPase
VVGKKRMFVDALDSQIQHRKAKISRLEATERDMEGTIDSKEQQVKQLLKKISKLKYLLGVVEDLENDLGCAEKRMEDMEKQHGELEESVSTLQEELFTLKETVGKVIRNM